MVNGGKLNREIASETPSFARGDFPLLNVKIRVFFQEFEKLHELRKSHKMSFQIKLSKVCTN